MQQNITVYHIVCVSNLLELEMPTRISHWFLRPWTMLRIWFAGYLADYWIHHWWPYLQWVTMYDKYWSRHGCTKPSVTCTISKIGEPAIFVFVLIISSITVSQTTYFCITHANIGYTLYWYCIWLPITTVLTDHKYHQMGCSSMLLNE